MVAGFLIEMEEKSTLETTRYVYIIKTRRNNKNGKDN